MASIATGYQLRVRKSGAGNSDRPTDPARADVDREAERTPSGAWGLYPASD